ncbi:IS630 family transposase [Streptomyces sp. HUAS TT7]|uniref:IS630 family transposase n=1 Tax=Streptomyces sp. HUAS TT7 TaxID=3447507 RepID=UPI003F65A692
MRYPQGGGLTAERRTFRERIRLQAAERFAVGQDNAKVARELRVSVRSVQRWRRPWHDGGQQALRSRGPAARSRLSDTLFAVLEAELGKGPVAHGWTNQTWTLVRIKTLIGRRFHKSLSLSTIADMLHRHGWSCQVPARRALERDEHQIRLGEGDLADGGSAAAALGAYVVFEDEAAFSMTPPTTRTWSRRGNTPIVRVRGRSACRISLAAMCCYRPGERSRLLYRMRQHKDTGRRAKGERRSFAWTDFRDLLSTAHRQLGAPLILVWDNLSTHRAAGLRDFIAEQDWVTSFQLPSYAPDLNPVEGIWSLLRRSSQANTAFADPEHLDRNLRHGLRKIQYRSDLIDDCLTATGLPQPRSR